MDVLFRHGIVEADDLVFEEVFDDVTAEIVQVRLSGSVTCCCGAKVKVLKWMDTRPETGGGIEVISVYYQYQAWLPATSGRRPQSLVRYDQAHGGQPHRHQFDARGQEATHEPLTLDTMPRLDSVIREAADLVATLRLEQN